MKSMTQKLKTVELFSGTQSFSKVMRKHGHETFTVDIENITADDGHGTDLVKDILDVTIDDFPYTPDIIWASPPCTVFSPASTHYYWEKRHTQMAAKKEHREIVRRHIDYVHQTYLLIDEWLKVGFTLMCPTFYFIENPVGVLRKLWFMRERHKETVTYCQYGGKNMKPTDIWTNAFWWTPRPKCNFGDPCHKPNPKGKKIHQYTLDGKEQKYKGGVDNKGNNFTTADKMERGKIPPALFEDILQQYPYDELCK